MLTLLHGTSSANRDDVFKKGLDSPFLTDSADQAAYYAGCACDEKGGTPIVLRIQVDPKFLRFDSAAMDEPVGYDGYSIEDLERRASRARSAAARKNPGWKKDGYVCIPETEYDISLKAVGSCWADCQVAPAQIEEVPFEMAPNGVHRLMPDVPHLKTDEVYISPPFTAGQNIKR